MSALNYLKGIDLVEIDDPLRPIKTVKPAVIGLVGTAGKGPLNTPVLILNSRREAQKQFGSARNDGFTIPKALDDIFDQGAATVVVVNVLDHENLTTEDTLSVTLNPHIGKLPKGFIKSIDDIDETISLGLTRVLQAGVVATGACGLTNASTSITVPDAIASKIIVGMVVTGNGIPVSVDGGGSPIPVTVVSKSGLTVVLSQAATATGSNAITFTKNAIVFTPADATNVQIFSPSNTAVALDQAAINALPANSQLRMTYDINLTENTDFTLNKETGEVRRVGDNGKILPGSTLSFDVTRVDDEVPFETLQDLIIGNGEAHTGLHALLTAKNTVALEPKILIATGFTHQKPDAVTRSPIVVELEIITRRLKAIAYIDCDDTTVTDAVAHKNDFANNNRLIFLYPWVKVLIPETNGQYGNRPMSARFAGMTAWMDNEHGFWNSPSNYPILGISGLSRSVTFGVGDFECEANYLAANNVSTVVNYEGYIAWGNRTASGMFINHRRIADMVNQSIVFHHMQYADRNITPTRIKNILQGVTEYLSRLKQNEAIIGGSAWIDPALNSKDVLSSGELVVDFDFTAPSPLEKLSFRSHLVGDYYEEIFQTDSPVRLVA
jgi:phage tail sheath protein FI